MAYEIIIKNETSAGMSKSPVAGSEAPAQATTAPSGGGSVAKGVKAAAGIGIAASFIASYADKIITHKISTVALRTGAQEQEDQMSWSYEIGKKAVGFVSSIAIGAATGGAVGAVVGGVLSLVSTAIDYSHKQEKLDLQRTVEDIGLRYVNARAGGSVASFSGSRMKNQ